MRIQKLSYKKKTIGIFNNIDLSRLKDPLSIKREDKMVYEDEKSHYDNVKSEMVEYETDEYKALKNKEECPYLISDADGKMFSGKLQTVSDQSEYYILVENNGKVEMYEVGSWYGYKMKILATTDEKEVDKAMKKLNRIPDERSEEDEAKEIDFEEKFDDDDADDAMVYVEKTRRLSESGTKLQSLVEELNVNGTNSYADAATQAQQEDTEKESVKKQKRILTEKDLIKIFGNKSISIKDLLRQLNKMDFKMDEDEKLVIKLFLQKRCKFEANPTTGEKLFRVL